MKVAAVADRFWERYLELDPLMGTDIGDERYDGLLEDTSAAGRAAAARVYDETLVEVAGIDGSTLSEEERLTVDLVEFAARRGLARADLNRLSAAAHNQLPAVILPAIASLQRVGDADGLERYVARLRTLPAYFAGWAEVLRESIEARQTSPALIVDRAIGQFERLLELDPASSPGMTPVSECDDAAKQRVLDVLREVVWPAHAMYLDELHAYRPHATETLGLHSVPGGEALYRAAMLEHTSLELDPADVFEEGQARLAEAVEEQRRTASELGFASAADAIASLRGTDRWAAATPEAMVARATELVQRGWDASREVVGRMPQAECIVQAVEPYRELDAGSAYYIGSSADGGRPGVYFINTSNLEERPLYQSAVTAFHEANPGHHLQHALEREQDGLHPVRRFGGFLAGAASAEGWALYAERLADELGLYDDGFQRLGMLESRCVRACRLVVDTGLHAFGWTRERAIDAMLDVGMTRTWSESDIDRYIAMPGQALAYTIGFSRVERWRTRAERRDGFSLRGFHDRLLSLGSLPLASLERALQSSSEV
ncbi:MAG TPA: DUF885 domain-containing protein [Gaiellaceae bacterium]|nr:DUF885 domain-containing protein [Gaiellaceae bacterium]